ncbi:MAG: hypothetical protein HC881_20125, partial [Leptolyngbyaceae cyanobacterium SL_7_1]|nr:hypothetical protein [Leptolyngbyaceae cyanobacterium SL_7_1]
ANVNDAPTVTGAIAAQTATEGVAFAFTVPAGFFTDVDAGDSLTYTATLTSAGLLPAWLSFDPTTQTLSGTPGDGDGGTLAIRITATDGALASVSADFQLVVNNVNTPPFLVTPIADQSIQEDSAFSFSIPPTSFGDSDVGDRLTYSVTQESGAPLPSWLGFEPTTRTLSGTPTNAEVGSLTLIVTATDSATQAISDTVVLTVTNVNDAPTLVSPIADQTPTIDTPFTLTLPPTTFNDIDGGDSLSYSVSRSDGGTLPSWLNFDSASLTLSGTPTSNDIGTVSIQIIATDLAGTSSSDSFDVTIAPIVNTPPIVANALPDQSATEGTPFSFAIAPTSFTDPDVGDRLTYTARQANGNALPNWLIFNPITVSFEGTPLRGDVASLTIEVTATDTGFNQVNDQFDLVVAGFNARPVVIPSRSSIAYASTIGSVAIDPALTLADSDSTTFSAATVTIVGFVSGQDTLTFVSSPGSPITGAFAADTGILSLTGVARSRLTKPPCAPSPIKH